MFTVRNQKCISMKQQILFLKGLPASGKSTFAKQYCLDYPEFIRLNKDDIREELGNPPWSNSFEKEVLNLQRSRGLEYLDNGFSIIIDDTNFAQKHYLFWKQIASERGIEMIVLPFDTPLEVCIQRDAEREKKVGKGVIMNMYNQYLKKENE